MAGEFPPLGGRRRRVSVTTPNGFSLLRARHLAGRTDVALGEAFGLRRTSREQQLIDTADHVTAVLTRMFRLSPESVSAEVPLHRLHIDSLALEELRLVLEDELHIDLEDVNLTSRSTVGQLVDAVCAKAVVA